MYYIGLETLINATDLDFIEEYTTYNSGRENSSAKTNIINIENKVNLTFCFQVKVQECKNLDINMKRFTLFGFGWFNKKRGRSKLYVKHLL